jgi:hypothetical protein
MRASARALLAATLAALPTVAIPSPAMADCITAEVWYSTNGGASRQYVLGPDHCVAPTPWPTRQEREAMTPPGTIRVGVGVTLAHP